MLADISCIKEAEAFLKHALVLDPSDADAAAGLAALYANAARWDGAIDTSLQTSIKEIGLDEQERK